MTHDITGAVKAGQANAIGVLTGRWSSARQVRQPVFVALVMVKLQGSAAPIFVASGPQWQERDQSYFTTATAWRADVDWTRREPGWSTPAFTPDKHWHPAPVVAHRLVSTRFMSTDWSASAVVL